MVVEEQEQEQVELWRAPWDHHTADRSCKMADMPDLSHLTAEERAIIEGVMMRQKQEEERENEIMR